MSPSLSEPGKTARLAKPSSWTENDGNAGCQFAFRGENCLISKPPRAVSAVQKRPEARSRQQADQIEVSQSTRAERSNVEGSADDLGVRATSRCALPRRHGFGRL